MDKERSRRRSSRTGIPYRDRPRGEASARRECDPSFVPEPEAGARRALAAEPEDLARLLMERVNAGDLDGVVALYELEAVLALPGEEVAA